MRENASDADHQRALELAALQIAVGGRQSEHEARADRLHVEGRAMGDAKLGLDGHGGGGKGLVGGRGGQDDEVDVLGREPRVVERRARRDGAHGRGELAVGGDPPLLDAGPLGDPAIGGVDHLGEVGIGHDPRRQVPAALP